MRIIDIREVQANLEQLIVEIKPGEMFVISVDGKPKAKVVGLTAEEIERVSQEKD